VTIAEHPTEIVDRTAALQQRTRAFALLYEQQAYRVYNLALRITCERDTAVQSTERAFLGQVDHPEDEQHLIAAVVGASLAAARTRPDPHGAGDEDSEAMLAATASLAGLERAALALAVLAEADTAQAAQIMGTSADTVERLRERGHERLGAALGLTPEQAKDSNEAWLWAAPPEDLWEDLFRAFHSALDRKLGGKSGASASRSVASSRPATQAKREQSPQPQEERQDADAPGPFSRLGARLSGPGARKALKWGIVLALLGGGLAWGSSQVFGGGENKPIGPVGAPPPAAVPNGNLSPAEVDKLRNRELAQARQQEHGGQAATDPLAARVPKPKQAKQLTPAQIKAAQKRQAQLARQQAARERRIAKQRNSQTALPPPPPPASTPKSSSSGPSTSSHAVGQDPTAGQGTGPTGPTGSTGAPPPSSGSSGSPSKGSPPSNKGEADAQCLFNPDTGTYVCPTS
jgi:hypothetical protein